MKKRIIALLLAFCLVLSVAPVHAGATTGQQITAGNVTVTAGNTAYMTLQAENFENIATLEVYVYYDPEVFTLSSASEGYILSGSQASVNTTEAGTVKLVAMSLDGINGSGDLLTLYFDTAGNCEPGTYPIRVAVGGAYDTSLAPAAIGSTNGSVTVNEQVETEYFYLYGYPDKYTLQKGDTVTFQVSASGQPFVSGDFLLEYDHELFAFDSFQLSSSMTGEGAIYSVNSSVLGQVRLAYASDTPVVAYELFTVKLTVIADVDTYTNLTVKASNMYREDLSQYLPGNSSYGLTLEKQPEVVDDPDAYLQTELLEVGKQSKSTFLLEAGAGVAAADFVLNYDPSVMRCVSVSIAETVEELGGMVVINDNFTDGTIRFSYVNMDAYDATDVPVVEIVWEPIQSPRMHHEVWISAVGVVDAEQNPVTLELVTDTGCIYNPVVTVPTCIARGYTTHTCAACGDSFVDSYVDIVPDAHHVLRDDRMWVDAIEIQNDATYPFELTDGVYSSTNKFDDSDSYFTITALYDCTLTLSYSVSSESGCDRIIFRRNGTTVTEASGITDWTELSISLVAGDTVTINYHKDGSVANGEDTAWFRFTYPQVEVGTFVRMPAADMEPTCTEPVVCCDCLITVKEALGHDEIAHEGKTVTCTEIGWDAYVTCSRCDYTTYVEKPALGHTDDSHEAKAPTCTEVGWEAYVDCSRCGHSTYQELPALGHRVMIDGTTWVDPITVENDASYPFALTDGIYSSTNHDDYSNSYFTITALYDCTLEIFYRVSSEAGCDRLIISQNGMVLADTSGVTEWANLSLPLKAGDTVTINYTKDVSVASYEDTGWFYYSCPQVQVGSLVPGPAEDAEPTCTDAVVCYYCQTVVKKALGHDEIAHEGKAPTCTEAGWDAYVTCSRCDYTTYVEKPALGHTDDSHEAKAPTCTEVGWEAYVDCSRCDYSTYQELPALGHRVMVDGTTWVDSITIQNDEAYPFDLTDGIYSSTNKTDSTDSYFTFTALYDCTLEIFYRVSSEENFDKVIIYHNGSNVAEISGTVDWTSVAIALAAGDMVQVNYHKDGSAQSGEDTGWFYYSCPQVQVGTLVPGPAEDAEPTCTEAVVCHYCQTVVKKALGHDEIAHEGKAPTCIEGGWSDYVTCSRCDYSTYTELPTTGHAYEVTDSKEATCEEDGYEVHTCANCGNSYTATLEATGHAYEVTDSKEATCEENGYEVYTCANCGDGYTVTLEAVGHTYEVTESKEATCEEDGFEVYTCGNCGDSYTVTLEATGHSYESVVTNPTCTEQGYTTHTCHCGESYIDSYVEPTGHAYEMTESRGPTCEENGYEVYTCGNCGNSYTVTLEATGHSYESVVTDPTCTEQGYTTHTCHCGESYIDSYVEPIGHAYEMTESKEATCEENGYEVYTCGNCGNSYTVTLEATGHSYESVVTDPTCTEQGYTTHTCHCGESYIDSYVEPIGHAYEMTESKEATCEENGYEVYTCGNCGNSYTVTLNATGHAYEVTESKEATCEEDGYEVHTCGNCGNNYTVTLEATGHRYESVVTDPTCTEQGYTTHTCHCGESYMDSYVEPTGHAYEVTDSKEATCEEDGFEVYTCGNCGDSYTVTLEATGHSYESVVTDPTCTEQGYTTHTCHCGESFVDSYTKALGHDWDEGVVIIEPTEETEGQRKHTCKRCGETEVKTIPVLGHEHSYEAVVTEPTCTEQGYTTHTCKCGESYIDSYVEPTGHAYEMTESKGPTCEENGYEVYTCGNCGDSYTVTVEATGHSYESVVTDPTCTEQGYTTHTCHCGESYIDSYVEPTGHAYEMTDSKEPTCEEDGYEVYTCANCGNSYTVTLEATGHSYETVVTDPTCTEQGYTTHTCHCGHSYVDSYVDALGHDMTEATCTEAAHCQRCDHAEGTALGHDYVDGVCSRCGEGEYVLGDINGDGEIDLMDANLAVGYYNETADLTDTQLIAADVNGDGEVDLMDANLIVGYYNETVDSFPAQN